MSQKHILVFSLMYHPHIGGAEIAVKEITSRMQDHYFHIVTLRGASDQKLVEHVGNTTIYRVKGFGPWALKKILYITLSQSIARAIYREHTINAVWGIMASYAGFAAQLFTRRYDVPFVLTLQEGDTPEALRHRFRIVYKWFKRVFYDADHIQTISHYLKEFAVTMGAHCPIVIVPNGVDYQKFSHPQHIISRDLPLFEKKPGELFLITTSRLVEKNGLEDVIAAMPNINKNVKFIIVGDGPLRRPLEYKARLLKVRDRIIFLGEQPHSLLPGYLQISDIFIRPSLSEGFGNSFVEAMAAGIPVIATDAGGIKDFLVHEQTGIVVQQKSPEDIANAVNRLANDQPLRHTLVQQAAAMVRERYDWNRVAEEIKTQVFAKVGA